MPSFSSIFTRYIGPYAIFAEEVTENLTFCGYHLAIFNKETRLRAVDVDDWSEARVYLDDWLTWCHLRAPRT